MGPLDIRLAGRHVLDQGDRARSGKALICAWHRMVADRARASYAGAYWNEVACMSSGLTSVEGAICWNCSTYIEPGHAFCTKCGAPVAAAPKPDPVAVTPQPEARVEAGESTPRPSTPSENQVEPHRGGQHALIAAVLALVVGCILLGVLWQSAASHQRSAERQLTSTQVQLASSQSQFEATAKQLKSVTGLANRRAAVLRQAQVVLRGVDPLLSGADKLQKITGTIQDDRDSFKTAAASLTGDLATLLDYVVRTDAAYWDLTYIDTLLASVRDESDAANSDLDALAADDTRYANASDAFGQLATSFSDKVRTLQHQLTVAARQ